MNFRERFEAYVDGVTDGSIITSRLTKLAIARHVSDMKRAATNKFDWELDWDLVAEACEFIELCPHVKGKWAKLKDNRIKLANWQVFYVGSVFGWVHKKHRTRRFNQSRLYVPRKNAKSTLAAAIGLKMAFADNEHGAEVYSGATTEDQAWEIFGPARQMVLTSPDMRHDLDLRVFSSSIVCNADNSVFETITGTPGDGASPSCALIDEYHEHKTSHTFDTMRTGMGARENPIIMVTSTAGTNLAGPCHDDWNLCINILEGTMSDDRLFILIYTKDKEDDWKSQISIIKANPNLDVSVSREHLASQLQEAINNTRKQAAYQTKHLNMWVQSAEAFFNVEEWKACGVDGLEPDKDREWIAVIDLASKVDAGVVLYYGLPRTPDEPAQIFCKTYIPEARLMNTMTDAGKNVKGNQHHDPKSDPNQHWRVWHKDGWVVATPGEVIDYEYIKQDILEFASGYNLLEVAFDPYQATMLVSALIRKQIDMVEYGNTVKTMSEPMKEAEAKIKKKQIVHDNNPVMLWFISNVEAKEDAKDNVYPRKANLDRARKIDGAVAYIMAVGRQIARDSDKMDDDSFSDFLSRPLMG
jgi:phage terminase large subunit-like protein